MIAAQRPLFSWPDIDADYRRLGNWLLIWIVMANGAFAALWFVGAPPRQIDILIAGLIGLIVKRFAFWVRYSAFVAFTVWTLLKFVGGLFSLTMSSLLYSIQFFLELKPANSLEYIGVFAVVACVLLLAWRVMRRDMDIKRPTLLLVAIAVTLLWASADAFMGRDMRGHYFRAAPAGTAFSSAAQQSDIAARADGKRHLVIVIVESLGVPKDNAEMDRLLFRQFKDNSAITARYDLQQGTTRYYNSTTAGEVRELCGRWGDYYDLVDQADATCLPAKLAAKGYHTLAMHSFVAPFFDRETWYPNVGFAEARFAGDLNAAGARKCGGVFAGVCDRDVPAQIGAALRNASKPTFLYWLTVNAHLPVPPGLNLNVDNCARISASLAENFPQICRQYAIFDDTDAALAKEFAAADFPDTDILIVGDHMPPYFDRHQRTQHDPTRVPWLYLKHKGSSD